MSGFVVPPIAARHNDPFVKQFVCVVHRIFDNRWDLGSDVIKDGTVVLEGFPELLLKPPKRGQDESTESYERRRADGMQSRLGVLCVLVACTDWTDHTVRDPRGGYLGVARIAELAGHPVADGEASDRTERALGDIRRATIIGYTKQHREQKPDGSFRSTGPALRRLSRWFFRRLGRMTTEIYERRCRQLKNRRDAARIEAARARRSHERTRGVVRGIVSASESRPPLPPASAPARPLRRIPEEMLDAIVAEHPEWSSSQLFAEALRRLDSS